MAINLDYSNVDDCEDDYPIHPTGWHELLIREVELKDAKTSGNQYLNVKFYNTKNQIYQFEIFSLVQQPFPKQKLFGLLNACSIDTSSGKVNFDEKELEGFVVKAEVKHRDKKYNGVIEKDENGKNVKESHIQKILKLNTKTPKSPDDINDGFDKINNDDKPPF